MRQSSQSMVDLRRGGLNSHEIMRTDRKGTIISKREKSHRITFADHVTNDKARLTDVYLVESYKKYNHDMNYGNQGCCNIV